MKVFISGFQFSTSWHSMVCGAYAGRKCLPLPVGQHPSGVTLRYPHYYHYATPRWTILLFLRSRSDKRLSL